MQYFERYSLKPWWDGVPERESMLPEDVKTEEVLLKYKLKEPGASPSWIGLVMAQESGEVWRWMLSTNATPEIGVFILKLSEQTADDSAPDDFLPGDKRPTALLRFSKNGMDAGFLASMDTPATYQVRKFSTIDYSFNEAYIPDLQEFLHQACLRFQSLTSSASVSLKDLKRSIPLNICDTEHNTWVGSTVQFEGRLQKLTNPRYSMQISYMYAEAHFRDAAAEAKI